MTVKCPKCYSENTSDSRFCKNCAAPLPSSDEISVSPTETLETPKEELTTGSTFAGRYQIIEELGKGGMGKVYKVLDKEINAKVALKLIKPEVASDKKTIKRFRDELKMARDISHKNVCRMYDLNKEDDRYYITMEFVSGEDLKSMIRMSRQLTTGTAISIAKQVCEGLAEAHQHGVVHRDLKSQNIMIDKEGNARIMDFGIARSLKEKGITGAGMMIGTPEYMSPEQAEGKEVDQRSDVYSLGVILYEMVTGQVPFEGETPLSLAMKHKSEAPKNPKELNGQVPPDLSQLILKCLEKDKENRYQNAEDLHNELSKIEEGIPITERAVPKRKPITSKEITVQFRLKKLFIPALVIIAFVIAGVILLQFLLQRVGVPIPSGKPSIAVLPFTDLSPQKDQEYFCDGMTDEIIAKLSRIEEWKVISRTSVMRYKNTDKNIKEIGQELDVATVLEGSIRKEKDDIRVTAQLVNVEDGFPLWSDIYDRKLERVFTIQSDIAEKIAEALKAKLSPEDKEQLQKSPTENLEAYNLYLQGRWFWNTRTEESLKKAIEYFEQAIEVDSKYALAYAGLADSYTMLGNYLYMLPKEVVPKAKEAALKALEIDNTLAEAHTSLAFILDYFEWHWKEAEEKYKRAIELNPNNANAHHWYASYLIRRARFDEAIKEINLALELDPLSLIINRNVGQQLYYARQYDQAIIALKRTIEKDPSFLRTHHYLGLAYLQKSMYEEALAEFQKERELWRGWWSDIESWIGIAYVRMGKRAKAQQVLHDFLERSKELSPQPTHLARLYFALGESDKGFELLDKAYKERAGDLPRFLTEPAHDSLRSDPRYIELLKKMGLEKGDKENGENF